jgi:hypothetical protein
MSIELTLLQVVAGGAQRWINRRASVRYQCAPATPGKVLAGSREEFLHAWVVDLSQSGAGIVLGRSIAIGQHIILKITSPTSNQRIGVSASVVRILEQPDGQWLAGLEFQQPLSLDELDTLLN